MKEIEKDFGKDSSVFKKLKNFSKKKNNNNLYKFFKILK